MSAKNKVFVITGASTGLGRAFAEAALGAGHTVVGTVRREDDRIEFEALQEKRAKAVIVDLTRLDALGSIIHDIEEEIGPIDVLVNNAGYGHEGTLEESPMAELVRQFEVNVFGAVAMIKAALPSMRGRISIPSSNGSVAGLPLKSQCVDSDIELHRGSGR